MDTLPRSLYRYERVAAPVLDAAIALDAHRLDVVGLRVDDPSVVLHLHGAGVASGDGDTYRAVRRLTGTLQVGRHEAAVEPSSSPWSAAESELALRPQDDRSTRHGPSAARAMTAPRRPVLRTLAGELALAATPTRPRRTRTRRVLRGGPLSPARWSAPPSGTLSERSGRVSASAGHAHRSSLSSAMPLRPHLPLLRGLDRPRPPRRHERGRARRARAGPGLHRRRPRRPRRAAPDRGRGRHQHRRRAPGPRPALLLGADEVDLFPAWETLPFERVSPCVETMGRRLRTMWRLRDPTSHAPRARRARCGPWCSASARTSRTSSRSSSRPASHRPGRPRRPGSSPAGYRREYQVEHRGEVAVRGSIVDVFPSTADAPVRIDLWGDEVDRLTEFSVADQRADRPIVVPSRSSRAASCCPPTRCASRAERSSAPSRGAASSGSAWPTGSRSTAWSRGCRG